MALDEPSHPPSDVDGEGGDEERRDELHDRQLGVVLALAPRQAQAQSSWSGAFRKVALDEEGEREDGVVDQDEGAPCPHGLAQLHHGLHALDCSEPSAVVGQQQVLKKFNVC